MAAAIVDKLTLEDVNRNGITDERLQQSVAEDHARMVKVLKIDKHYKNTSGKKIENDAQKKTKFKEPYEAEQRRKQGKADLARETKAVVLDSVTCPQCNANAELVKTAQTRSLDEGATSFYRCPKCAHTWQVG